MSRRANVAYYVTAWLLAGVLSYAGELLAPLSWYR